MVYMNRVLLTFRRGLTVSAQHRSPFSTLDGYTLPDSDPDLDEYHQLNNTLHSLVLSGHFSAAERLRLKIVSNGLHIQPRAEYSRVALACIHNRRLSGATGFKLNEYLTWLDLVPDRENLPSPPLSSPFDQIVHAITYRATVSRFRPFLSHTALTVASKGFARRHLLALARPIVLASSRPASPFVVALVGMEERAVQYEQMHERPSTPTAAYIRCSLIHLFAQRGWLWKSVDLILSEREYVLPDHAYKVVMEGIHGTPQVHKKEQILKKWDKDKTRRLWATMEQE